MDRELLPWGTVLKPTPTDPAEQEFVLWWEEMANRLGLNERVGVFFSKALGPQGALAEIKKIGGDPQYVLFVLSRYWIPAVLPPPGRERLSKSDSDYWLESEHILKTAVIRLRELKPLIDLLTASNPLSPSIAPPASQSPVVEVELANILEGIAEVAGSYGGPDYTSVVKNFDPIPLRQTQPFKHNKKNSAELWVVFLLREHFKSLGLGKDRYWPIIAHVIAAADIRNPHGQPYGADELKSWWQKNWPRTYTQVDRQLTGSDSSGTAYHHDFAWFQAWLVWQQGTGRPSKK